jgi:hypothetical protein
MKTQPIRSRIVDAASLLSILLLACFFGPARAAAQSSTEPVAPELFHTRLEIGPVAGLTTAWHPAPVRTAIPLGVTVQLRIKTPLTASVRWTGAREIDRNPGGSNAEVKFDSLGLRTVSVVTDDPYEGHLEETSVFEVLNTTTPATVGFDPISLSVLRVTADAIVIDPLKANASSLAFFFRSSSIAALRKLGDDHFRTSINRSLVLEAVIQPSAFAPLVEWRLDGIPQRHLGSPVRLEIHTTGPHTLSAGPLGSEKTVQIDTYRVRIISHQPADDIPEGLPVNFRAETDPPGFEGDITWLASTKFGTAQPWSGSGAELKVRFVSITSPMGAWLGVRADNDTLSLDPDGSANVTTFSPLACALAVRTDFFQPDKIALFDGFCSGTAAIPETDCDDCVVDWANCHFQKCGFGSGGGGLDGFLGTLQGGCTLNLDVILGCSLAHDYCVHRCKPPDLIPLPEP